MINGFDVGFHFHVVTHNNSDSGVYSRINFRRIIRIFDSEINSKATIILKNPKFTN